MTTKKLAGITIHNITHVEAAYLIDGAGYKRALFVWPFSPQDVKQALRQLWSCRTSSCPGGGSTSVVAVEARG